MGKDKAIREESANTIETDDGPRLLKVRGPWSLALDPRDYFYYVGDGNPTSAPEMSSTRRFVTVKDLPHEDLGVVLNCCWLDSTRPGHIGEPRWLTREEAGRLEWSTVVDFRDSLSTLTPESIVEVATSLLLADEYYPRSKRDFVVFPESFLTRLSPTATLFVPGSSRHPMPESSYGWPPD